MFEHNGELRDRVEQRRMELQDELEHAEQRNHPPERVQELETELRIVEDALTGGWDCVGEVTAQQLSRWLEATRNLITNDDPDERITAEMPVVQYE